MLVMIWVFIDVFDHIHATANSVPESACILDSSVLFQESKNFISIIQLKLNNIPVVFSKFCFICYVTSWLSCF